MTDTFKKLAQSQAPAAAAAIYTVPGSTQAIVRQIIVVNTDTVARDITLYDGGSAAGNVIHGLTTLQPNETMFMDCYITMASGGTLQALGSVASKLTITVYGLEIS